MSDYKTPGKARFEMNVGISSTPNSKEPEADIDFGGVEHEASDNVCPQVDEI